LIKIKNLRVKTIIGVKPHERRRKQEVVINLQLEFDGEKAARSDHLADAVDYESIGRRIVADAAKRKFHLLERLCRHVLELAMENPRVLRATVEIDKPGALQSADSVSITAVLDRDSVKAGFIAPDAQADS